MVSIHLFSCFILPHLILSVASTKFGKQHVLLQQAMHSMLGYRDEPSVKIGQHLPDPYDIKQEAPKYMLDLYSRFRDSQIYKGQLKGNTVRSIHGNIGDVNNESMFVFNLSALANTEKIISAEIHLYKRKSKRRELEMLLYEIAPHYMTETGKIHLRSATYGWQWYDVTDSVASCLAARRETPHLFALNFNAERKNGQMKSVLLKKFIAHHSTPFLIVYSNDSQSINLDQLENIADKFKVDDATQGARLRGDGGSTRFGEGDIRKDMSRTFINTHVPEETSIHNMDLKRQTEALLLGKRRKRDVFDNEIPENPDDFPANFPHEGGVIFPEMHPDILQTKQESRYKLSKSKPKLIPYPNDQKTRRRRRRNRRRKNRLRRKNRNKLAFPKEWNKVKGVDPPKTRRKLCSRRSLVLDFADIGWEDKIIAPKSFEAHYCAGSCPFPLTRKLQPSNHATIQSIVHTIGIHSEVPAPCCVPEEMTSVTLLYFDQDRNVVLKNYPNMSVKSCACR